MALRDAGVTGRLLGVGVLFLFILPAAAQVPGDYNGDGYVDGDDFWYWAGCMTGPGASFSDPNCAAFDFDLSRAPDGKVDLGDFGGFARGFTGSPCTPGHKYAHVSKDDTATGCSAKIRTRPTTLCGEPSVRTASSCSAWAGATKYDGQQPIKWGQTGYRRFRNQGESIIKRRVYAETKAGPNPVSDYEMWLNDGEPNEPSEGTHTYRCYVTFPTSGKWRYVYDGSVVHEYTHNGWVNVLGTRYQWVAEIWHKENRMVGTASAKCDFTECKFATNWQSFQDADIETGDLHTDDPNEWGIERTSATSFNVWDKKP